MPNLWDKTAETSSPSELNPLTNPLLERNLGRWAQVYLNTPPAKREQAVNTLLEELKRESGQAPDTAPVRPYFARDARSQPNVCSICQRQNPPGHKFCSRCGQPLELIQPGGSSAVAPEAASSNSGSTNAAATERAIADRVAAEYRAAEHAAARNTLPQPYSAEQVPRFPNDVHWLRDRSFSGLGGFEAPPRKGWKYILGAAVIVLAGYAYVRWSQEITAPVVTNAAPQSIAPTSRPNAAAHNAAPLPPLTEPQHPAETIISGSKSSEVRSPSGAAKALDRTAVAPGIQPAAQKSPLLDAPGSRPSVPELESGAADLRLAQRYLGGSMGTRDSSEAAKLLWRAVSKQNTTAAVLLSQLYSRGDGVPRSCDQARLLLVAAAKRGAPQAAQELRNLDTQGCR